MMTELECTELIKRRCSEQGWTFRPPVKINKGLFNWEIISNADMIGCNARLTVDKKTGEIIEEKFIPR